MQQGTPITNPAQLYPQYVPGLIPPPVQQQPTIQAIRTAIPPNASTGADTVSLPTSASANIPGTNLVQTQLANSKAVPIGMKYGLMFGALASLPIWKIEQHWCKKTGQQESNNLIVQLLKLGEQIKHPGVHPSKLPLSSKLTSKMEKPLVSFLTSAAGTGLVGVLTGGTLGWWGVKHIKSKLVDINEMKEAQQAGTFQPKPLTLAQRLGLSKKPTNNPDQDYQTLLQTNLNTAQAFRHGAYDVAIFKALPGVLPIATICGYYGLSKKFKFTNKLAWLTDNPKFWQAAKLTIHPVFIAKLAALPIIGGLIARQTVPWVKEQLQISEPKPQPAQAALNPPIMLPNAVPGA